MSELPPGVEPAEPPAPVDSASGVVLVVGAGETGAADGPPVSVGPRVLVGRRAARSRFMPGAYAFPGGKVDAGDGAGDARFRVAASRELIEETGLGIDADAWSAAGERITPPVFPRRFLTRFFVTVIDGFTPPDPLPSPDEIDALEVVRPADLLEAWRRGRARIAPPVLPMLRALEALWADGAVGDAAAGAGAGTGAGTEAGTEAGTVGAGTVGAGTGGPVGGAVDEAAVAARLAEVNRGEQRAPRIEFVPDLWMLPVRTRTLPPATHTNVWLPGGKRFVVVDPGCGRPEDIDALMRVVERRAEGGRPAGVLLTHEHPDHTAGAAEVARRLNVELIGHPLALEQVGFSGSNRAVREGARLDLDGVTLEAWHTPGHSPGHLAFRWCERPVLIAGDLVSGISTILIHPVHGHMGDYLASLRRVAASDVRVLLPGHGPPVSSKEVVRVIAHREQRERRIVAALAEDGRLESVAAQAYRDQPGLPAALTEGQTLAHLVQLEREGRAARVGDSGRVWAPGSSAGTDGATS